MPFIIMLITGVCILFTIYFVESGEKVFAFFIVIISLLGLLATIGIKTKIIGVKKENQMDIKYSLGDVVVLKADPSRAGVIISSAHNEAALEGKKTVYKIRFGNLEIAELFEFEITTTGKMAYLNESGTA